MPQIGQDLYDELIEFLEDQQDADCIGDPPAYKPNKAMSMLMRLENNGKSVKGVGGQIHGLSARKTGGNPDLTPEGTTRESAGEGIAVRRPNEDSSHLERTSPQNTAVNEVLLSRARDLLYQCQGSLGWIGAMNSEVLRQQIKTFLEYTKEPPQVLAECEECERIIVSPLRRFERAS